MRNTINQNIFNHNVFLENIKPQILDSLNIFDGEMKYNLKLKSTYQIPMNDETIENRSFEMVAREMFAVSNIDNDLWEEFTQLLEEENNHTPKRSLFNIKSIDVIMEYIYKYPPLRDTSDIDC